MKIKKLGHCCLLVTVDGLNILTDPGNYSTSQNDLKGISVLLLSHEHADHFHTESVIAIVKNNPDIKIITNATVGKRLDDMKIPYTALEKNSTTLQVGSVTLEAFECKHEIIYEEIGQTQNTGYMINGQLFYPGDSFHNPGKPVDILALPVAGPWCKLSDAIRYALDVAPRIAFPVHDGVLHHGSLGFTQLILGQIFEKYKIGFISMRENDEREF
jgi:L-ascorbate metabolism protein UlaG (beta-lactamase superfamily)